MLTAEGVAAVLPAPSPAPTDGPIVLEVRVPQGSLVIAAGVADGSRAAWGAAVAVGADAPANAMRATIEEFFGTGLGRKLVELTARHREVAGASAAAEAKAAEAERAWLARAGEGADTTAARAEFRKLRDEAGDLRIECDTMAAALAELKRATRDALHARLVEKWGDLAGSRPAALDAAEKAAADLAVELNKPSVVSAAVKYTAALAELRTLAGGADLVKLVKADGRLS